MSSHQRQSGGSFVPHGMPSQLGLQGRLLEVAVVVGMDEETGLEQRMLEHSAVENGSDSLFHFHYKANLLDIISGTQEQSQIAAMVVQGSSTSDPQEWRKSLRQMKATKPRRSNNKNVQRARSVRKLRQKANKAEEVPVSTDFLVNLPYICLPDNSKVYQEEQKPQVHFVVLTDISGSRHYAAILTIYQLFYATKGHSLNTWKLTRTKNSRSLSQVTESSDAASVDAEPVKCYVPHCICLVSCLPYFDVLKRSLSCLLREIKALPSQDTLRKMLEKYVTNLSVVLCPPPLLTITFTLAGWPFTMLSSPEPSKPDFVTDLDLRIPLFVFMRQPAVLLQVLACLLLEQRVVFISENYSLISLTMEALLCFIRPFTWPHQYVPLLFSEIIDFVACPGIFLMGCHAMHREQIEQVENDQILVDLDTGKAFMCASYEFEANGNQEQVKSLDLKLDSYLPAAIVDKVVKRLTDLRIHNTVAGLSIPSPVTIEEVHNAEVEMKAENNSKIQEIFMEMMVDLFGTTIYYVDHELNQFRSDEFMETIRPSDLPFYLKVVKTYMFKRFVEDRLKRSEDSFSRIAEDRRKRTGARAIMARRTFGKIRSMGDVVIAPQRKLSSRSSVTGAFPGRRPTVKNNVSPRSSPTISRPFDLRSVSKNEQDGAVPEVEKGNLTIALPTFPVLGTNFNPGHFYRRCAENVTDALTKLLKSVSTNDIQSDSGGHTASVRAGCLIARGLYHIALGEAVKGLEDLHATEQIDYRTFPEKLIKKVVNSLSPKQLQLFRSQSFYKGDVFYDNSEQKQRNESYYSDNELPYNPINKTTLSLILEKSDVTSDGDVIDHVFDALSGESDEIDPEIFAAFYHTWTQVRHDCENALRSLLSATKANMGILQDSERLLKVSSVVSSNKGSGRLILTTRKVLFLTELYQECKHIIRLNQINELKLSKLKAVFHSTPALSIKCDDNPPFRVALKSECELWRSLITEMKTGRMLSRDWKDHAMTLDGAAQNVGIANALYQAAQDEGFMSPESALECVQTLCNFTRLHQSGQLRAVPLETDEMLLLRIDMAPKEAKKTTISAILYSSAGIDEIPRVWVALASRKIRLIDTTQWKLDSRPIKDCNSVLHTMCMVRGGELWVGAEDTNIYAIRTNNMKKSRVLHKHSSSVLSVFLCGKKVVSAADSGEVIIWNDELNKPELNFQSLQSPDSLICASNMGESNIYCCSKSSVVIMTLKGELCQRLTLNDFQSAPFRDSHITCCTNREEDQLWVGDSTGSMYIWHRRSFVNSSHQDISEPPIGDRFNRLTPKCTGLLFDVHSDISITCIMCHEQNAWVGNSVGDIIILSSDTLCQDRVLKAHDAAVTSLCLVGNRYVISGSASKDGKVAVWRLLIHSSR